MTKEQNHFEKYNVSQEDLDLADKTIAMVEFATLHIPNTALKNHGHQESDSPDGKQFWYYLSIPPSQYPAYKQAYENEKTINPRNYGEILACGWGNIPPDHIIQKMAHEHGCQPNFENELQSLIEKKSATLSNKDN